MWYENGKPLELIIWETGFGILNKNGHHCAQELWGHLKMQNLDLGFPVACEPSSICVYWVSSSGCHLSKDKNFIGEENRKTSSKIIFFRALDYISVDFHAVQ